MDVAVLLWGGTTDDEVLSALRRRGVPTVLVEGSRSADVPVVGIDDRGGMQRLATHLTELGHRRISVVTLPFSRERHEGLVAEADQAHPAWDITGRRLAGVLDAGVRPHSVWETPARSSSTVPPPAAPS
ncbi:hypothetical protein [Cellulomonas soli]